jgi:Fe-S-cluster containining protein
MIGSMQEIINNMKSGIYDFTVDGKCSSCGACCSNVLPLSGKEIKEIKRYVKKHRIKEQKHLAPMANNILDLTCPFRDDVNRKCLIYDIRPGICRDFQCDKTPKGIQASKELYHKKHQIVDLREEFFRE